MMNEKMKFYQRDFTIEDQSIIDYINQYHCIQKINIIQFTQNEQNELLNKIIKNQQTIKIQCSLSQLLTNEFIDYLLNNQTIEMISQTTQNHSIIIHYHHMTFYFILEQQEYQILGLNGEFNKMTNRYYVKLPLQTIKQSFSEMTQMNQLKERLQLFPIIPLLLWTTETNELQQLIQKQNIPIKIQQHHIQQKHYSDAIFDFTVPNLYEVIGAITTEMKTVTNVYHQFAFNMTKIVTAKEQEMYQTIVEGTIQSELTKEMLLGEKIIVIYPFQHAPMLCGNAYHNFTEINNEIILTIVCHNNQCKLFIEYPSSDHVVIH